MPQTDINEAFLFVTPSPVLGVWFYCSTNGTPCFLRVQFLTSLKRSPYLVLLGARPTVLGHNLEKYERNLNSPDRLPSTTNTETEKQWKFQLSLLKNFETSEIWKLQQTSQTSSILEYPFYWETEAAIQRISENPFFCEEIEKDFKQPINTYGNYQTNC